MTQLFGRRGVVLLVLGIVVAACSPSDAAQTEIRVSAASSLTLAFGEIEILFEERNPDVDVVFNFGSSALLREQILSGAPIHVFASADRHNMGMVDEFTVEDPVVFASNMLMVAVPSGNPGAVTGLEDFGRDDLFLGLCARGVPCGDLAIAALEAAGVTTAKHSAETNARSLLIKTAEGELDASIVYVSDVRTEPLVDGIDIADQFNQSTEYPVAVVTGSPDGGDASSFIEFLLSETAQSVMSDHGFSAP